MKAIWKGSISFGLVNIPVKMYSASQSNSLDLDMLSKDGHCPIQFKRVCRDTGEEIPYKEIVKGYKYKDGDYVILTDKDFESANVEKTNTIDIIHFVDAKEIDTVFYEKPYFLEPEKSSAKSYMLLLEAIKKSKKTGIARFVIKSREHIGAIRLYKDIIVLNQLRFQDEIRDPKDIKITGNAKVSAKEVEMAIQLIKQFEEDFNPSEYKDEYITELMKIIEQKAKGKKVKPRGKQPKPTNVKNLMSLLKASMKKKVA